MGAARAPGHLFGTSATRFATGRRQTEATEGQLLSLQQSVQEREERIAVREQRVQEREKRIAVREEHVQEREESIAVREQRVQEREERIAFRELSDGLPPDQPPASSAPAFPLAAAVPMPPADAKAPPATAAALRSATGRSSSRLASRSYERSSGEATWRNICYGRPDERRLPVHLAPDRSQRDAAASVPFGERLQAVRALKDGNDLWLQLRNFAEAGERWVLAEDAGAVNCVEIRKWRHLAGRTPDAAFRGQDFPRVGMYTEGYAGSDPVCLVSASGDAFWREISIEMMFRDIPTATVFEREWDDQNFTDWVAYYAANVVLHGGQKRLLVTVRPTQRWRSFLENCCRGPSVEDVVGDLGKAQAKECRWLRLSAQRFRFRWEDVEFITTFTFLKEHCQWSAEDCAQAAVDNLRALSHMWAGLDEDERGDRLAVAFWCLDEALQGRELGTEDGRTLRGLLLSCGPSWEPWPLLEASGGAAWLRPAAAAAPHPAAGRGSELGRRAAAEGRVEALRGLAKAGADLGAAGRDGRTPAYLAALHGHAEALWFLKEAGADLSAAGRDGRTPACLAALHGHAEALQVLAKAGADLSTAGPDGQTPVHLVARNGQAEALRGLADAGVALSAAGEFGATLAHLAAGSGHDEALRVLAEAGAALSARDEFGATPAHLAAGNGHDKALRVLAQAGAALSAADQFGRTPAHLAALRGHAYVLRVLASFGAPLNTEDQFDRTPAHDAALYGHAEAWRVLTEARASAASRGRRRPAALRSL